MVHGYEMILCNKFNYSHCRTQKKKNQNTPVNLYGLFELRDKVGPIKIMYNSKTETTFNSVQASQLGTTMFHFLKPLHDTTILDIGCGFGVISLMLAHVSIGSKLFNNTLIKSFIGSLDSYYYYFSLGKRKSDWN